MYQITRYYSEIRPKDTDDEKTYHPETWKTIRGTGRRHEHGSINLHPYQRAY